MKSRALKALNLDKIGATASTICAIHCVLTGVAIGLLSALGISFIADPLVDFLFIGIAVSVGLVALVHGIRKHKSWVPATFYVLGLVCIVLAHFHGAHYGHHVEPGGHIHDALATWLSVFGGAGFVCFHVLNARKQHQHDATCSCCKPMCEHPEG